MLGQPAFLSFKASDKNHSKPGICVKVNTAVTNGLRHRATNEEYDVSRLRGEKQVRAVHNTADISGLSRQDTGLRHTHCAAEGTLADQ
jgi:hypothetical protein